MEVALFCAPKAATSKATASPERGTIVSTPYSFEIIVLFDGVLSLTANVSWFKELFLFWLGIVFQQWIAVFLHGENIIDVCPYMDSQCKQYFPVSRSGAQTQLSIAMVQNAGDAENERDSNDGGGVNKKSNISEFKNKLGKTSGIRFDIKSNLNGEINDSLES